MVHRRRFCKIYSLEFCDITWQNFSFYRILSNENFKMEDFMTHLIIAVQ